MIAEVLILLPFVLLGCALLFALRAGQRSDEKEYQAEVKRWQEYETAQDSRRAEIGRAWALEDYNHYQAGRPVQGLPIGTPGPIRRAYFAQLNQLEYKTVQAIAGYRADRIRTAQRERAALVGVK